MAYPNQADDDSMNINSLAEDLHKLLKGVPGGATPKADVLTALQVLRAMRTRAEHLVQDSVLRRTRLWAMLKAPKGKERSWKKVKRTLMREEKKLEDHRCRRVLPMVVLRKEELEAAFGKERSPFLALPPGKQQRQQLHRPVRCYICKQQYTELHSFYHSLCPDCGDHNLTKREQTRDLTGKTVLLTGARVKIGHQAALKLLRAGARVVATTRFTNDAARRFARAPDSNEWWERLLLVRLDLRDMSAVKRFCGWLMGCVGEGGLFAVVHNAAQTVARPESYYEGLLRGEAGDALVAGQDGGGPCMGNLLEEVTDRRSSNSWTARLADVAPEEVATVHLVNCIAPFTLTALLKECLTPRSPGTRHFVINVSAMEGQFYRGYKSASHPHTNMAKAALNMLTRTSGADYAKANIFMNSVDTGWVSLEDPYDRRKAAFSKGFVCPLDEVDGAARVLDHIFTDSDEHSKFWKDYRPAPW